MPTDLDAFLVSKARAAASDAGEDPDVAEAAVRADRAAQKAAKRAKEVEEQRLGAVTMPAESMEKLTAARQKGQKVAARKSSLKAEAVWGEFEQMVAAGSTVEEACSKVGRAVNSYYRRRTKHPEFAARIDEIRAKMFAGRGDRPKFDGSSASFATRFIPPPEDAGVEWPAEPYSYSFYQHAVSNVLDGARDGDIILILLPPGGRKTTTLENWAIGKIAQDPNVRIGYISKALDHAKKSVGRIKQLLHDDPRLAPELSSKWGPFKELGQEKRGKPWATQYLTVANRTSSTRDYTFSATGAGSQIYGARFDYMVLDDFQTNQNINETEKLLHQFQFEILTRRPTGKSSNGRRRGVVVLIGTRIDAGDFYEQLEEKYAGQDWFKVVEFPVMRDGKSMDEDCFPTETLADERKQVGEVVWLTSYMQQPPTKTNATFTKVDIEASKKPKLLLGWNRIGDDGLPTRQERGAGWGVVVGLDPNLGAGWSVITAAAFNANRFRVLDQRAEFGLAQTEDLLDMLEDYAVRYRPEWVRIETDAFQRGLARDHRLIGDPKSGKVGLTQKHGFHVREHMTTGGRKDDMTIGVSRMGAMFRRQEIDIPWGDDHAIQVMEPMTNELRAWRPRVSGKNLQQDRVMSLWFCWIVWLEQQGLLDGARRTQAGWSTKKMPGGTSGYVTLGGRKVS